jgi:hypothetical protein
MFEALLKKIDPEALDAHEKTESADSEAAEDDEPADLKKNSAIPTLHFNAGDFGKPIYKDDKITIVPTVLMQERVTNGALKLFSEFAPSAYKFEHVPVIPPHKQGDAPVSHKTPELGFITRPVINAENKSVDAYTVFFNDRIVPADLQRIWNGEPMGNSPGYYCNDEILPESRTWEDGTRYSSIERGPYRPNHMSMVPRGACPLPFCGANVPSSAPPLDERDISRILDGLRMNSQSQISQSDIMAEKIEGSQQNPNDAEAAIKANAAAPEVQKEPQKPSTDALELKVNALVADMEKIKAENAKLNEEAKLRQNAQAQAENEIFAQNVFLRVNAATQLDWDKTHKAEFMADPLAWLKKNIGAFKGNEKVIVQPPVGAAFVPQLATNADDEELKANAAAVDFLKKGVH